MPSVMRTIVSYPPLIIWAAPFREAEERTKMTGEALAPVTSGPRRPVPGRDLDLAVLTCRARAASPCTSRVTVVPACTSSYLTMAVPALSAAGCADPRHGLAWTADPGVKLTNSHGCSPAVLRSLTTTGLRARRAPGAPSIVSSSERVRGLLSRAPLPRPCCHLERAITARCRIPQHDSKAPVMPQSDLVAKAEAKCRRKH